MHKQKDTEGLLNLITHWDNPENKLASQYGPVTFLDWCEREVRRMARGGVSARVVWRNFNCAIARD